MTEYVVIKVDFDKKRVKVERRSVNTRKAPPYVTEVRTYDGSHIIVKIYIRSDIAQYIKMDYLLNRIREQIPSSDEENPDYRAFELKQEVEELLANITNLVELYRKHCTDSSQC